MSRNTSGVAVALDDLTRVYGTTKALDGLTLHIEPGGNWWRCWGGHRGGAARPPR